MLIVGVLGVSLAFSGGGLALIHFGHPNLAMAAGVVAAGCILSIVPLNGG